MKDENRLNMKYLGNYGFDEEILNAMIKHDVMFPVDIRTDKKGKKDFIIKKSDVQMFINKMLKNQMKVYELLEKVDADCEKAKDVVVKA